MSRGSLAFPRSSISLHFSARFSHSCVFYVIYPWLCKCFGIIYNVSWFFFSFTPFLFYVCYSLNLITLRVSRVIKRHIDYFLFPHHDSRENSEIALSRFLVIGSLQRGALAQSKEKASDFVQDRVRIKDLYFFFLLFCLQWKLRDIFMWFWLKGTFLLSA